MAFRAYVTDKKAHLDDLLAVSGKDWLSDGLEYGGFILGVGLFVVDPTFTVAGIVSAFALPVAARSYKNWKGRSIQKRLYAAEAGLVDALYGLERVQSGLRACHRDFERRGRWP